MAGKSGGFSFSVFDERTQEYDVWFDTNKIIYENELKAVSFFQKIEPSIEIGIGTGRFAGPLRVAFGLDPSVESLKIALNRGSEVVRATAEDMPIRTNVFRTAYMIVTLCFVSDPHRALRSVYEILKNGGRLITCIVPRDSDWGKFYDEKKKSGKTIFYKMAKFYSREEVKSMLMGTGFKIVGVTSVLFSPPGEAVKSEQPRLDESGSFVCYESIKA